DSRDRGARRHAGRAEVPHSNRRHGGVLHGSGRQRGRHLSAREADVTGTVLQVNVSQGGIPKREIPFGELTPSGISGDSWRYRFHGGPKQAVLLITMEGIEEL